MLRLGIHERGITEILGLAEHVVSTSAAAGGLRLRPDVPAGGEAASLELITVPVEPSDEARSTWAEISAWSNKSLGLEHVPAFWRAFSHRPRLLAAIWAKHQLVLSAGELPADAKLAAALAVAMNKHSDYWTGYYAQAGRHAGVFDDEVILEIAAATLHYTSFNTIAHGMMLEAPTRDLRASDFASEPPRTG
ncbi:MAG TPA: hypothetical protein VFC31_01395 [Candidatus Limnocylindria bacterium]|nr:hypothetical protein [Candidatus Limnocylindria bacterium]